MTGLRWVYRRIEAFAAEHPAEFGAIIRQLMRNPEFWADDDAWRHFEIPMAAVYAAIEETVEPGAIDINEETT